MEAKEEKNDKDVNINQIDNDTELEFCQEVMNVLCGEQEVPFKPGTFIKDRSVHPEFSQRDLALDYLHHVVNNMKFSVPVKIETQGWLQDKHNIIMGNFVVTVEGTEIKDKAVIVGAHYDVQNNLSRCWRGAGGDYLVTSGADDNTSGTVGCLALLRRFSKSPPKKTTIVVCFDGEEPGAYINMAAGSLYFVKQLQKQQQQYSYTSAVIVDMIGGPPTIPKFGFVISTSNKVDHTALDAEINSHLNNECSGITIAHMNSRLNCLNLSDSTNFQKIGIPTVLLCNIAGYESVPTFYHTEEDTVDVINWETFLWAVDILQFLATNDIPVKQEVEIKPNPEMVETIVSMGFTQQQAEFALISKKNNLEAALNALV